jgi:apolipoprotein N-acyltransferase
LIQIARWTGTSGVSFLIVLVNAALALALQRKQKPGRALLLPVALLIAVCAWGKRELDRAPDLSTAPRVRIAILQGNIDQYQKWDEAYESSIRKTYEDLMTEAARQQPQLIVWPESAVPGWFPNQEKYRVWVSSLAAMSGAYNIVGAVTAHDGRQYNAAFLLGPAGAVLGEYDKQHMVPFGEYVPFGGFLVRWIPYLGELGAFSAGTAPVLFHAGALTIAPNICYEAIFPALVKRGADQGASLIVNITNDGWFLDTGAPAQHYAANVFRAIENRAPVVRAANTGISAIIDAHGREQLRSPLLKRGVFVGSVVIADNPR